LAGKNLGSRVKITIPSNWLEQFGGGNFRKEIDHGLELEMWKVP